MQHFQSTIREKTDVNLKFNNSKQSKLVITTIIRNIIEVIRCKKIVYFKIGL